MRDLKKRKGAVTVVSGGVDEESLAEIARYRNLAESLQNRLAEQDTAFREQEESYKAIILNYETTIEQRFQQMMMLPELLSAREYLAQSNDELRDQLILLKKKHTERSVDIFSMGFVAPEVGIEGAANEELTKTLQVRFAMCESIYACVYIL